MLASKSSVDLFVNFGNASNVALYFAKYLVFIYLFIPRSVKRLKTQNMCQAYCSIMYSERLNLFVKFNFGRSAFGNIMLCVCGPNYCSGRMNYLQIERNEREVEQTCLHPNCHRTVFKRSDSGKFEYQTPSSHRGTLSTAVYDNLNAKSNAADRGSALRLRRHEVAKRVYSDIADVCIAFHCRGKVPGSYGYLKCASDNRCLG